MRLWSLHPRYLDAAGLVALWREGLLARKVLSGGTRGYTRHPQLVRFREMPVPMAVIDAYLSGVLDEARERGYRFDATKISYSVMPGALEIPQGQLNYEFGHLLRKLAHRDPERFDKLKHMEGVEPHPLFRVVPGGVCPWEVVSDENSD